jgi:hypothetical protein
MPGLKEYKHPVSRHFKKSNNMEIAFILFIIFAGLVSIAYILGDTQKEGAESA